MLGLGLGDMSMPRIAREPTKRNGPLKVTKHRHNGFKIKTDHMENKPSKKTVIKYKWRCQTCGTEVYSNEKIDMCCACGSNDIKKHKASDATNIDYTMPEVSQPKAVTIDWKMIVAFLLITIGVVCMFVL